MFISLLDGAELRDLAFEFAALTHQIMPLVIKVIIYRAVAMALLDQLQLRMSWPEFSSHVITTVTLGSARKPIFYHFPVVV